VLIDAVNKFCLKCSLLEFLVLLRSSPAREMSKWQKKMEILNVRRILLIKWLVARNAN